jgi:hypothetical protein
MMLIAGSSATAGKSRSARVASGSLRQVGSPLSPPYRSKQIGVYSVVRGIDVDEDEYITNYDGVSQKVEKRYDEPRDMGDFCDQSTEGTGQGFNARFESRSSGYDNDLPMVAIEKGHREWTTVSVSLGLIVVSIVAVVIGIYWNRRNRYPVIVDYSRAVPQDLSYYAKYFPSSRTGTTPVEIRLVTLDPPSNNPYASHDLRTIASELDKRGLRPADLRELVALYEQYPKALVPENDGSSLIYYAFGSVWQDSYNGYISRSVVRLRLTRKIDHQLEREFELHNMDNSDYGGYCDRFLAVRK